MKTKIHSQSGFLGSLSLIALLFCVAAFSITTAIPTTLGLGFFRPETPAKVSHKTLTFEERVGHQRAIEEVYWRHRIWPTERPDSKPSLDAVMSQAQLEEKVEDYQRNSQALEDCWQRPLTAGQLQAEMERMAQYTKQPEVLRELFAALGNDPFVIAECLARPVLSERMVAKFYADAKERLDSSRARADNQMPKLMAAASANYTVPTISDAPNGCIDDTWTATSTTNAPTARSGDTAVWTGSEMIVWGGSNTGGKYSPSTDSWTATSTTNAPTARSQHTAVWTGSEMIVWGGVPFTFPTGTGGRYNPIMDSWTAISTTNAPSSRRGHTAVWTGGKMIVWGGTDILARALNTGGRYNPSTDSWTATSTTNAPSARAVHTAVWTGNQMIVWGGAAGGLVFNSGGRYNPSRNSWTATSITNAPSARGRHTAVWTGSEMIVWGGQDTNGNVLNTGRRYNPGTDSWRATRTAGAPSGRKFHTAVWTEDEMIVWGGEVIGGNVLDTGGRYNPGTNTWTPTSIINAPTARGDHTAVWTGSQMIVWGGSVVTSNQSLNTGGRYCAQAGAPTPTPTGVLHAAVYYPWFPQAWGNLSDPFTNYHPSLGYYSSDDASVIAKHVDAMIYAHLDAGISSWWGQGENTENTRFPAQLAAANGKPFKWTLYYEKEGYGDPTASELTADLNYIKSKYANNSSYLTRNGKPVIFVYGDGTDGCGMADRWKQANAAVGNTFYVVLKVFGGYTSCVSQPDGWHQYGPAGAEDHQPGYSFMISPGFWKKGESAPRLTRDPNRWRTNIIDMMNSHEPLQLVETFSEWGEGTAVESAQEWASSSGYGTYLDALHNLLPASLTNTSTRLKVLTGDNVLIGGLIIGGSDSMTVLFRALGPTLSAFDVPGALADPTLELHTTDMGHDVVVATNDNWKVDDQTHQSQQAAITATGKAPPHDSESAILRTLAPGNYTVIVRGKNNGTGVALVEAYDVSTGANSELLNISSRGFVDTNANVMIGGFIVGSPSNFLVRALGPTLEAFNIPGAMTDPTLELHDANGAMIASNDNWKVDDQTHQSQQAAITATGKAPPHDSESAILRTLAPGNYTAILKGKNNTTGIALLEVYNVP